MWIEDKIVLIGSSVDKLISLMCQKCDKGTINISAKNQQFSKHSKRTKNRNAFI